jgi:hypothetical protein
MLPLWPSRDRNRASAMRQSLGRSNAGALPRPRLPNPLGARAPCGEEVYPFAGFEPWACLGGGFSIRARAIRTFTLGLGSLRLATAPTRESVRPLA